MIRVFHRYLEKAYREFLEARFWCIGSFPSVLVKEAMGRINVEKDVNYFYGSAQNRFWPTLARILFRRGLVASQDLSCGWQKQTAIDERKHLLEILGVGLTDLYVEVESKGRASDEDLCPLRWNPYLEEIVSRAEYVFVTSQRVASKVVMFSRNKGDIREKVVVLPSPSPLSRRVGYTDDALEERYEEILSCFLPALKR